MLRLRPSSIDQSQHVILAGCEPTADSYFWQYRGVSVFFGLPVFGNSTSRKRILDEDHRKSAKRRHHQRLMADIVDKATRSRMMASIRGKNTKPEVLLRRCLHADGIRFRLHAKLPGTPDLAFRRFGAVCFVHGCFWHQHRGCSLATTPTTRPEFWQAKFHANVERDRLAKQKLLETGWRVAIVWECALRGDRIVDTVATLKKWLHGNQREYETDVTGAAERLYDDPAGRATGPTNLAVAEDADKTS